MPDKDQPRFSQRLGRASKLAKVGARGAAGAAARKARGMAGMETASSHEMYAERLTEVLGEMKGAAMKLGQLLSFVDLDMPDDVRDTYHQTMASLRDSAPAHDVDEIIGVIEASYGKPLTQVFTSFEDKPLAAASIGQVHAATLIDGTSVVVKVQYPGVAASVAADVRNAETLAPLVRLISPNLELRPLLDELRERVLDELDYEREAQYQDAFARRYAEHPFIKVPAIERDLCTKDVLVSERVHGLGFEDFCDTASAEEKRRVGEIIFRYAFGSIARYRLFNGDPHPGNYLMMDDGRVAFLDYGSVKMFTAERMDRMDALDRAMFDGDTAAFSAELINSGFLGENHTLDIEHLREWFALFTRPMTAEQPFTYTRAFATEVIRSTTALDSPWINELRQMNLPPDYLLLNRIQWGINSVLARLEASGYWRDIIEELRWEGPPATELGHADAAWREKGHSRG